MWPYFFFIIFSAFSGLSKYSILGCIRLISQFVSFELIFTTIILILIWCWNDLSIASYFLFIEQPYISFFAFTSAFQSFQDLSLVFASAFHSALSLPFIIPSFLHSLFSIFPYFTFGNFHLVLAFFFICILAESNRVPFDLPEAESELVAGFITEYSSFYFSLILLTEYANIIGMSFWMIILFSIFPLSLLLVLFFVCLIRSTLNRLKFDELMTNAWIVLLPILFYVLFISLLY